MEEKPEEPLPSDKERQPILCEECKINPSKYKCPGCSIRSCCLPCVKSHKLRTACTGKRPVTNFVPISKFDDNLLVSDYNMLEDVKRIADSAQRMRLKLCGPTQLKRPHPLRILRDAASKRRTKLQFLSSGMSRRQTNRTYYDDRNKFISWTLEWRFHSTDVALVDHGVNENTTLSSVIENHLKPGPWNHKLKQFCDETLDSLKFFIRKYSKVCDQTRPFFIRKYSKGQKSPYRQLNINAPIRAQLANMGILEYPVIHVFLPSHTYDFEVITDANPTKMAIKEPDHLDYPSPKGVMFKEEEIEDDGSFDPQVSDLKESVHSPPGKRARSVSHTDTRVTAQDNSIKSCLEELAAIGEIDIEFEPGLMDMYPDFITGSNPDDFLDFEGLLADAKDVDRGEYIMDDDIEEGEIV